MALSNICPTAICSDLPFMLTTDGLGADLDDAGSAIAAIVLVQPGEQIDEIGFHVVRAYGVGTTFRVGVESLSASDQGTPNGYIETNAKSASTPISGVIGDYVWASLLAPYRNETSDPKIVALTVREGATSFSNTNHVPMSFGRTSVASQQFPYGSTKTGSAAWAPTACTPSIVARGAGKFVAGTLPGTGASSPWSDSATSNLYQGNVWTASGACRLSAVSFALKPADDADFAVRVYVNGVLEFNAELPETAAGYADLDETAGTYTLPITPVVLEAGDVVRTVLEPLTSNEITLPLVMFSNSAQRLEFTRGIDLRFTEGSSTPTWTDIDTQLAAISPVIDQIGSAAGASSGSNGSVSTKLSVRSGKQSYIAQVFIPDATSSSGEGMTGLTFDSSGLSAYYMRADLGAPVGFDSGAGTLNTMTIGTYAASGFVEIDDETMPGWYQLGIPNAAFAAGAESVSIVLRGAPNMAQVNIEIAIDQEVTLAPRGFDSLGVPAFIDSEDEPVNEPVSTTLDTLTWPERIWYSSQWIVGGREDNRDLKKLTLLANDGLTTKASAEYTDAANVVNVPPMSLN